MTAVQKVYVNRISRSLIWGTYIFAINISITQVSGENPRLSAVGALTDSFHMNP
jgi:hypothetical protein